MRFSGLHMMPLSRYYKTKNIQDLNNKINFKILKLRKVEAKTSKGLLVKNCFKNTTLNSKAEGVLF